MKATEPLKSIKDINKLKNYFLKRKEYRNYLLVIICLNTALRISDVLSLCWNDIYDFKSNKIKSHIKINEQKTGKLQSIYINKNIENAVNIYISNTDINSNYIFKGKKDKAITRIQVNRILNKACENTGIPHISCHSLRKSFGYHAWKNGTQPAILMAIYNHSNFNITKRYLGISQDDKDYVYKNIKL